MSVIRLALALSLLASPVARASQVFEATGPLPSTELLEDVTTDGAGTVVGVYVTPRRESDWDAWVVRSTDGGLTWVPPALLDSPPPANTREDVPRIATDRNGTWIAVWSARQAGEGNIKVSRSTDGGATWSPAVHVDAAADTGGRNDMSPDAAADGTGAWIVAWRARPVGSILDDRPTSTLIARSLDGGITWTPAIVIDTDEPTRVECRQLEVTCPVFSTLHVESNGAGTVLVAWTAFDVVGQDPPSDFEVVAVRTTDGGSTWSPQISINADAGSESFSDAQVELASDGIGTWVAAWIRRGSAVSATRMTARSADDGLGWSAPIPQFETVSVVNGEEIHVATDGVTWFLAADVNPFASFHQRLEGGPLIARSTDAGVTWSTPTFADQFRVDLRVVPAEPGAWVALGQDASVTFEGTTLAARSAAPCDPAPRLGCRQAGSKSSLRLQRYPTNAARDTIDLKLLGAAATTFAELGEPATTTDYALCLYDTSGNVVVAAAAPANGTCGSKPCWRAAGAKRWTYADHAGTPHGLGKVALMAGAEGKTKVQASGKSALLSMPILPAPPVGLPYRVQVQSGTGACWEASFATVRTSMPNKLILAAD